MKRKFIRDVIRKEVGNKNLRDMWKSFQLEKYGEDYLKVCSRKRKKI